MPNPQYPTQEGNWSNKDREEEGYKKIKWGFPYGEAVDNFRRAIQGREDFDPAVMFVWGTMQATGVLNFLKLAEEQFGEEGQALVRKALNQAGYEAMAGLIDNSEFPDGLSDVEMMSFIGTGLNKATNATRSSKLSMPTLRARSRMPELSS